MGLTGIAGGAYWSQTKAMHPGEFHRIEIEMTRVNWGKPGFCTEFATDYDPSLGRCRSGGSPYKRKFITLKDEVVDE